MEGRSHDMDYLEEITILQARVKKLEGNDRLQLQILKVMGTLMALGALLSGYSFSNPANRIAIESVAIALLTAGASGMLLAPAVEKGKES